MPVQRVSSGDSGPRPWDAPSFLANKKAGRREQAGQPMSCPGHSTHPAARGPADLSRSWFASEGLSSNPNPPTTGCEPLTPFANLSIGDSNSTRHGGLQPGPPGCWRSQLLPVHLPHPDSCFCLDL